MSEAVKDKSIPYTLGMLARGLNETHKRLNAAIEDPNGNVADLGAAAVNARHCCKISANTLERIAAIIEKEQADARK